MDEVKQVLSDAGFGTSQVNRMLNFLDAAGFTITKKPGEVSRCINCGKGQIGIGDGVCYLCDGPLLIVKKDEPVRAYVTRWEKTESGIMKGFCDENHLVTILAPGNQLLSEFAPPWHLHAPKNSQKAVEVLPPHQDWDGACTHREAYEKVHTHTRVESLPNSPDVCKECSEAIQEWVQWPCPRMQKSNSAEEKFQATDYLTNEEAEKYEIEKKLQEHFDKTGHQFSIHGKLLMGDDRSDPETYGKEIYVASYSCVECEKSNLAGEQDSSATETH